MGNSRSTALPGQCPKEWELLWPGLAVAWLPKAFECGGWHAVIDAHRVKSHDAAEWLRYSSALLHTLQPGLETSKHQQQHQVALAFVQARREGATRNSGIFAGEP